MLSSGSKAKINDFLVKFETEAERENKKISPQDFGNMLGAFLAGAKRQ
jgi:capsular polysaccharide biosynthesis protein